MTGQTFAAVRDACSSQKKSCLLEFTLVLGSSSSTFTQYLLVFLSTGNEEKLERDAHISFLSFL